MRRLGPITAFAAIATSALVLASTPAGAHTGDPAGGTPLEDLVPASIVAVLGAALLAFLGVRYRRGGVGWLRSLAGFSERVGGMPSYAALPAAIGGISLVVAVFGFYWDVSTHIDNGRDAGPFANPSHFFILAGLIGIAIAGYVAVLIGVDAPSRTSVRLADGWHVPVGGMLLTLCGVVALAGFPLDDVWHRLFGQDVTLWGPTHIQMVGGASLATLAIWILLREALAAEGVRDDARAPTVVRGAEVMLGGAFLLGLSTLQGEFDFGVPQFPLLYHPVLLMLAAGIGLVTGRILLGRGGALACVAFFLLMRGGLTLLVGPVLDRSLLHFPLFLVEALLVEGAAHFVRRERQLTLGLVAGALIGTLGLAAEWLWSHVWMPLPWPEAFFPSGAVAGLAAAVAGGVIGGVIGQSLLPAGVERQRFPTGVPAVAMLVAVACLAYPSIDTDGPPVRADVVLEEAATAGGRTVHATVTLEPADAADDALWFEALSWQGREWSDGGLVRSDLDEVSPGVYRTADPVPVHGEWKTVVRLHRDRSLQAIPVFMPEDPAIPAEGIPADARFTREFQSDKSLLQREAVGGNATLQTIGYLVLLLIAIAWLASMAWGLRRLDRAAEGTDGARRPPAERRSDRVGHAPALAVDR
jgi:hypothetical protein